MEAYDATSTICEGAWDEQSRQLDDTAAFKTQERVYDLQRAISSASMAPRFKKQAWQTLCIGLHIQEVKAEANFGSATPAAMAKWLCPKLICQISTQQDTQRGRVSQQAQQRECNG